MNKFKIAVIDTALDIDKLLDDIRGKVEIIDYFERDTNAVHSALVINTLLKYTDASFIEKIYLYNVFNKENRGSGISTVNALEDILQKNDVDFLLMSITLSNEERYKYCESLCEKIVSAGTTIVASDSNRFMESRCYPFSFECVYGVSRGEFLESPFFCVDDIKKKHIFGDSVAEFVHYGENDYMLFGGNSKAVPKFLAEIINAMSKKSHFNRENVEAWIIEKSLPEDKNLLCKRNRPIYLSDDRIRIYDKICNYIREYPIGMNEYGSISPSFELIQLGSCDLVRFLVFVLERFDISTRLDLMTYTDFETLGDFCNYIGRQIK